MSAVVALAPRSAAEGCAYCGEPFNPAEYGSSRTRDHIVPRSMQISPDRPASGRGNVVYACGRCNGLKSNMLPSAIRATANEHRRRAELLDQIADRTDELIAERRLLP